MVEWHHQLNGHEFEQTLGDSEGQGSLACCSPWGCKELDMTQQLNNNFLSSCLPAVFRIECDRLEGRKEKNLRVGGLKDLWTGSLWAYTKRHRNMELTYRICSGTLENTFQISQELRGRAGRRGDLAGAGYRNYSKRNKGKKKDGCKGHHGGLEDAPRSQAASTSACPPVFSCPTLWVGVKLPFLHSQPFAW